MPDNITPNFSFPEPHQDNDISHDIARLILQVRALDTELQTIKTIAQSAAPNSALSAYLQSSQVNIANGVAGLNGSSQIDAARIPNSLKGRYKLIAEWDAATNTPALPSPSTATEGNTYVVSVAGTTVVNGNNDWLPGDLAVDNGTAYVRFAAREAFVRLDHRIISNQTNFTFLGKYRNTYRLRLRNLQVTAGSGVPQFRYMDDVGAEIAGSAYRSTHYGPAHTPGDSRIAATSTGNNLPLHMLHTLAADNTLLAVGGLGLSGEITIQPVANSGSGFTSLLRADLYAEFGGSTGTIFYNIFSSVNMPGNFGGFRLYFGQNIASGSVTVECTTS
jgi:hypothetical protein